MKSIMDPCLIKR